ncbi:hypothetical protein T02_16445, partial [Trichinella nativa]
LRNRLNLKMRGHQSPVKYQCPCCYSSKHIYLI